MIRASQGGVQQMKEFLAKEQKDRDKAILEKNKMTEGFKPNVYTYARLVFKMEQVNVQIHEKEEQVGKKPPLYDFSSFAISYESRLELEQKTLQNHFAAR